LKPCQIFDSAMVQRRQLGSAGSGKKKILFSDAKTPCFQAHTLVISL